MALGREDQGGIYDLIQDLMIQGVGLLPSLSGAPGLPWGSV